jgi:predicted ester cyclase
VAARITLRGTHKGNFSGVPATSREANIQAALICRISQNKIAEVWAYPNELGLLRQLGVIPCGISRS